MPVVVSGALTTWANSSMARSRSPRKIASIPRIASACASARARVLPTVSASSASPQGPSRSMRLVKMYRRATGMAIA